MTTLEALERLREHINSMIVEEKVKNDSPYIVDTYWKSKHSPLVVLCDGGVDNCTFSGTVVARNDKFDLGEYSESWLKDAFTQVCQEWKEAKA